MVDVDTHNGCHLEEKVHAEQTRFGHRQNLAYIILFGRSLCLSRAPAVDPFVQAEKASRLTLCQCVLVNHITVRIVHTDCNVISCFGEGDGGSSCRAYRL